MKYFPIFAVLTILTIVSCTKPSDACSVFGLTVNDIEWQLINAGEQNLALALKETEQTNGGIIRLNPGISGSTYPFSINSIGLGGQISDKHLASTINTENQFGILRIDGEGYNSIDENTGLDRPTKRKLEIIDRFDGTERHFELSNRTNSKLLFDFQMHTPRSFYHEAQPSEYFLSKEANGILLKWKPSNSETHTTFVTIRASRQADGLDNFFKLYKLTSETGEYLIPASDIEEIRGEIPQLHLYRMNFKSVPDLRDQTRKNTFIVSTSLGGSIQWD